jgi:hypothetical protein
MHQRVKICPLFQGALQLYVNFSVCFSFIVSDLGLFNITAVGIQLLFSYRPMLEESCHAPIMYVKLTRYPHVAYVEHGMSLIILIRGIECFEPVNQFNISDCVLYVGCQIWSIHGVSNQGKHAPCSNCKIRIRTFATSGN